MLCRLSWAFTPEERKKRYDEDSKGAAMVGGILTNLIYAAPWYLGWVGVAIAAQPSVVFNYLFAHSMLSIFCGLICAGFAMFNSGKDNMRIWYFHMIDALGYIFRSLSFGILFVVSQGLLER